MDASDPTFILVTDEHLLNVKVSLDGRRLLDVLIDPNTSFLSVSNVRAFRKSCGTLVAELPEAIVKKSNIALAIPIGDRHEAPGKRRDSYVNKKRYSVCLIVSGHDVRGELALRGTNDPKTALYRELHSFFPVPYGSVALTSAGDSRQSAQVVIVNRDHVSLFHLTPIEDDRSRPSVHLEPRGVLPLGGEPEGTSPNITEAEPASPNA